MLNKRDLADPELTERWIEHFEKEQGVKAIAITTSAKEEVNHVMELVRKLAPHREQMGKNIMGIPNVVNRPSSTVWLDVRLR